MVVLQYLDLSPRVCKHIPDAFTVKNEVNKNNEKVENIYKEYKKEENIYEIMRNICNVSLN